MEGVTGLGGLGVDFIIQANGNRRASGKGDGLRSGRPCNLGRSWSRVKAVVVDFKVIQDRLHAGKVGEVRRRILLFSFAADVAGQLHHALIHAGHDAGPDKDMVVGEGLLYLGLDLPIRRRGLVGLREQGRGEGQGKGTGNHILANGGGGALHGLLLSGLLSPVWRVIDSSQSRDTDALAAVELPVW